LHLLREPFSETIKDIVEMGSEIHELRVEILLDGHGLDEVKKFVLKSGDLVSPDDGIDIHEPFVRASDAGDNFAILLLILDVDDGGSGCMDLLFEAIEPEIRDDVADLEEQAPVFKIERHTGARIVLDMAGVFHLLEVVEEDNLAGIGCINRIAQDSLESHRIPRQLCEYSLQNPFGIVVYYGRMRKKLYSLVIPLRGLIPLHLI
jgi:hypothetical protein